MTRHAIPDAALDDRLGFLGMTGSGKTFGAGTCIERILRKGGRVIIPDPLSVWFGLRLMADGKTPSPFDIAIFGGPHADLPITPQAGALIGETVATMRESAIIDLSQFETAASERRFMLAFLDALYRKSTGEPVHLIFDEADLWAPERIVDREGEATKLHGVMQTVVRRGRIKGLTSWLISQRPAALSKNVLSQVDGLAAFRLTASQDRKALGLWIEGQADKEEGKAILNRLPTKGMGEAVVWLPQRGILTDVKFPMKETFDSSRAPKRGEAVRRTALKPLNLDALKTKLASVEADVKASHIPTLRAEIARLNGELKKSSQTQTDPHAIEDAKRQGYSIGAADTARQYDTAIAVLFQGWDAVAPKLERLQIEMNVLRHFKAETQSGSPPQRAKVTSVAPRGFAPDVRQTPRLAHKPSSEVNGDGTSPTVRKILDVIHRSHPVALTFDAASLRAGVSRRSSAYRSYRQQVEASQEIERRSDGRFMSAPGYSAPVGPGIDPVQEFASKLPPSYANMLMVIARARSPLTKNEIADGANVSLTSSGLTAGLSELTKLSLIEKSGDTFSLHRDLQ